MDTSAIPIGSLALYVLPGPHSHGFLPDGWELCDARPWPAPPPLAEKWLWNGVSFTPADQVRYTKKVR